MSLKIIDADQMMALLKKHHFRGIKEMLAEADDVVRCWECKYRNSPQCHMCFEEYYDGIDGGDYYIIDKAVDPNGFCYYGEREDDGNQI